MNAKELIDLETLVEIKKVAPQVTETPPKEARLILAVLDGDTSEFSTRHIGMDDRPYFEAWLSDIQEYLPEALTPKRAGLLCRAMGLTLFRQNKGMRIAWTQPQIDILRGYLGKK
jgi:hypothetical protein